MKTIQTIEYIILFIYKIQICSNMMFGHINGIRVLYKKLNRE